MSKRKKQGITWLASGLVFVAVGVTSLWWGEAHEWIVGVLPTVGAIAEAVGFKLVFPDVD